MNNPEFTPLELFRLRSVVARNYGQPVSEEAVKILERDFHPIEEEIMGTLTREEVIQELIDLKRYGREKGLSVSRPSLCVDFLNVNISYTMLEIGTKAIIRGNLLEFAAWFDVSGGLARATSIIHAVENEIMGQSDQFMSQVVSEGGKGAIGNLADVYLFGRRLITQMTPLLIDDPSGFSLIARMMEILKEENVEEPYVKEFVIFGAELGQKIYRTIYPYSENL